MFHFDQTNIRNAFVELLEISPAGQRGGFVIFEGKTDLDYVQFSLEPIGLVLNWPTYQPGGKERLPKFVVVLQKSGFVAATKGFQSLIPGQYLIMDDGLYAQCGRNLDTVTGLTALLLSEVFEVSELPKSRITLELNG